MDSFSHDRQSIIRKIRLLAGFSASLLLAGYGILCIIRGYGFEFSMRTPTVWHGTRATALGAEYIAWSIIIVTLILLTNLVGRYLQLMHVILFFLSFIVIVLATWFRYSSLAIVPTKVRYNALVIVIIGMIIMKLFVIFVLAKWALRTEDIEIMD